MGSIVPLRPRGGLSKLDKGRLHLFARGPGKHLNATELNEAVDWCEVYGANPFANDIYFFVFDAKDPEKRRMVPVLSIKLYRKIAARAKDYRPDENPPVFTYDDKLIGPANPKGIVDCTVTVYKFSHGAWHPIRERIKWEERAPLVTKTWEGPRGNRKLVQLEQPILDPSKTNWHTMPETMLAKCFDEETEVLTSKGFRRFADVDAPILQVTEAGLEPVVAQPFFQQYTGDMIVLNGKKCLNFSVTPNHDMVTTAGKIEAGNMFEQARSRPRHFIPRIASGRSIDAPIDDAEIKLAAALLCDGYRRANRKMSVAVSRTYKVERLRSFGLHESEHTRSAVGDTAQLKCGRIITTQRDKQVFTYDADVFGRLIQPNKEPDMEAFLSLSERQARLFVDEMILFDGTINKNTGVKRFAQNDGTIADIFEIMACAGGYCVSRTKRPGGQLVMTLSDRNAMPVVRWNRDYNGFDKGEPRVGLERKPNSGRGVWCVTVPSGVIIVRRRSFSMVCGNCVEAAAIRKGWPEETEGSYGEGELDAAHTIDLTASEIVETVEIEERQARLGGPSIAIDWMDGKPIDTVAVEHAFGKIMDFFRSNDAMTVAAFWHHNKAARQGLWERKPDESLQLKAEFEKIERGMK